MRPDLFTHTINLLRRGETAEELSEKLADCVARARETGKLSELTLKIKIKPDANGRQVFITEEIKSRLPQFPREQTILFPTEQNDLQRSDPRQAELPGMRSVDDDKPTKFKTAQEA